MLGTFPDVGRCIRHRNDYGAILLLGMEFCQDFVLDDRCKVLCQMVFGQSLDYSLVARF